jgi:adenylate cyclase
MKSFFNEQFEVEFLSSEKLRISILLGIFLFGTIYTGITCFNFSESATPELEDSMFKASLFLAGMTLFELLTLCITIIQIRKGYRLTTPLWTHYLNAFIEITSPTLLMIMLANGISESYIVLNSPIVNLYFVFITLSTLRLDFRISLFISVVGAIEFLVLGLTMIQAPTVETIHQLHNSTFASTGKSIVIMLTGLGAAFVAGQIRKKIDRALIVAEKGSRIVNLFGQQVSREVVDEMLESEGEVPSKLMRVCVMFIDIRNFTSHVMGMTPTEIVSYQNSFFSIVIEVVARKGGIINQFLGDGCMITFGAPVPLANPCECAVEAALEIKERLSEQAHQNIMPATTIGVGIHVGHAVTGNIGTELRQQYSITGSVVILAARIEQLNKDFKSQILISAEVIGDLGRINDKVEHMGKVLLKGWSEPVGIYKLA